MYLKKLDNRSKLARLRLNQKINSPVLLEVNCYPNSSKPTGRQFLSSNVGNLERHPLYQAEEHEQDKIVYIETTHNHNYEVWACGALDSQPTDYQNFMNLPHRKSSRLQLTISISETSYPRLTKAVLVNTLTNEER